MNETVVGERIEEARDLYALPQEPQLYHDYESHRAQGDIYWDETLGGWAVLSFAGCERVETDEETFARWDRPDLVSPEELDAIHQLHGGPRTLLLVQGDDHFKLHGGLSLALTKQVRHMRPEIERLARRYAEEIGEEADFGTVFSDRFPTAAMTAVMQLSWVDNQDLLTETQRCTAAINGATTTNDRSSDIFRAGIEASRELSAMLRPDVERLIATDEGSLAAQLYRVGSEIYDDWTVDDVVVQFRLLYFAGTSSLAHQLKNQMYVLASHPALWDRLNADRSLVPTFVEESLRVIPAVQARGRVATRDVELLGVTVQQGQHVFVLNGAANRDPAQYECPAHMDLDQKPRRHLAFNAGPRSCPGTPTARMEAVAALNALLDRFASVALDDRFPTPEFTGRMNFGYIPVYIRTQLRKG